MMLVGREREQARVAQLLTEGRVVTLTGPGGCGKTRLAEAVTDQVAGQVAEGATWVDLAGLRDPDLVPAVVARSLGVADADRPPGSWLVEHLGGRELLLVLDNCEHLLEACTDLVSRLQQAGPGLRVLATSRSPLAISGEWTYAVPPLAVPGPGSRSAAEVARAPAARLFTLRARQVHDGFRLTEDNAAEVAEICTRLEGMPLAIELAAARVRLLAVAQIAAGLSDRFRILQGSARDVPARQRSLEASVAWSYELLDPAERLALARLSTFRGSFALDAAEAVVGGDGIERSTVLELVTALVDHSLLEVVERRHEARFRLLETIRLYAHRRLTELEDPDRARGRHLDFFVDHARRLGADLADPGQRDRVLVRLSCDLDDLRGAMDWAMQVGRAHDVLRIGEATHGFWMLRGRYVELQRRLEAALEAGSVADAERLRGLSAGSVLGVLGGAPVAGAAWADEAVTLARALDDRAALARGLAERAWCGYFSGEAGTAEIRAGCQEAEALAQQSGDPQLGRVVAAHVGHLVLLADSLEEGIARLTELLDDDAEVAADHLDAHLHVFTGVWTAFTGDLAGARARAHRTLAFSQRSGFPAGEAHARVGLAVADLLGADTAAAEGQLERSREVAGKQGLMLFELVPTVWSAVVAYHRDELDRAWDEARAALASARRVGQRWWEAALLWMTGMVALRRGQPAEARSTLEQARSRSCDPRYPLWLGRTLLGLAHVELLDDEIDAAWELAHDALRCLAEYGDRVGTTGAVESVAGLQVLTGEATPAVRLLAAAQRFRSETGVIRCPQEHDVVERARAAAAGMLDAGAFDAHWAEGATMSLDAATAYARRGRGSRGRPDTGWASLTPTERDVVRLVADGCSNREIASRLFVAVSTVKTHLSHVYTKLPVQGRTDLAAQAAARGDELGGHGPTDRDPPVG